MTKEALIQQIGQAMAESQGEPYWAYEADYNEVAEAVYDRLFDLNIIEPSDPRSLTQRDLHAADL